MGGRFVNTTQRFPNFHVGCLQAVRKNKSAFLTIPSFSRLSPTPGFSFFIVCFKSNQFTTMQGFCISWQNTMANSINIDILCGCCWVGSMKPTVRPAGQTLRTALHNPKMAA